MTREETVKIIRIMVDSYPNYKPNNISETVDVWHMMLSEYTYEQISVALKAYILSDTSGFAPSIGQLVDKIKTVTIPQELNEMEAWSLVSKAIRNSCYNSIEEYAKLPTLVQKAVGLPDQLRTWALDENYNEQVVSSNFMRCYRNEVEREKKILSMPKDVQVLLQNGSENSYKAQIETKREFAIKSLIERKESENEALKRMESKNKISSETEEKLRSLHNTI